MIPQTILTRSDFDDSKKDKKLKPKHGVKGITVTVIVLGMTMNDFDLVTIVISTGYNCGLTRASLRDYD